MIKYILKPSVKLIPSEIVDETSKSSGFISDLNNELRLYDYLQKCNIIDEYESIPATKSTATTVDEMEYISKYLENLKNITAKAFLKIYKQQRLMKGFKQLLQF
ncbi:MAG: hypothetical protein IPP73_07615 [Chitinophagaceae bacterium]|nr:hypothetical protein [Chitinophagaceae bacterium]